MAESNGKRRLGAKRIPPASRKPSTESLSKLTSLEKDAETTLYGNASPSEDSAKISSLESLVRTVTRRIESTNNRLTGGNTLETMSRLRQDSLMQTPLNVNSSSTGPTSEQMINAGNTLQKALNSADAAMLSDIYSSERARFNDYTTFQQIYDLITQASESVQAYADNIISPDDFTKRDIVAFYEGDDDGGEGAKLVASRTRELLEKYDLEDKTETSIITSLTKGDAFVAVLNLRQELESLLNEQSDPQGQGSQLITEHHVPAITDPDVEAFLHEAGVTEDDPDFRRNMANYINDLVVIRESATNIVSNYSEKQSFLNKMLGNKKPKASGETADKATLSQSGIRGSIVKIIDPENVIKLYQDDTLFGYYFVETSSVETSESLRRAGMDQTAVIRAIDQNLASKALGGSMLDQKGKDALVSRIIVKTLVAKLGDAKFLVDHEEFASDAYAVLAKARQDRKRAIFTFVAPDQMIHFTPNGATGYGESVLSRIKFVAKLYIGAITNAFMRNSIRRPERLVWYIDVGQDNDAANAVQTFIRNIKQREVKFGNLKDITTTLNQVGEFHDFYIPTFGGNRPAEVETLNMGAAAEVDSPFLEYLRKAIIGGSGVPAAYLGYSEEVAFARSLTMDNGRFLRRVVRLQKHFGKATTRLFRALYRNEYYALEEITGTDKSKDKSKSEEPSVSIDVDKIFVRFPSPATLNMTNLTDAVNQSQQVISYVVDTMTAAHPDGEEIKPYFQLMVAKDMLPQMHWERYEKMVQDARDIVNKIKASKTTNQGGDAGSDGDM